MAGTTWTVVRQVPDQYDFANPANPALGVIVFFVTGEGNDGSVFIPQARYNVKTVREMVAVRAKIADEVGALEGSA